MRLLSQTQKERLNHKAVLLRVLNQQLREACLLKFQMIRICDSEQASLLLASLIVISNVKIKAQ